MNTTENFSFYLLDYGLTAWHSFVNENFEKIDTLLKPLQDFSSFASSGLLYFYSDTKTIRKIDFTNGLLLYDGELKFTTQIPFNLQVNDDVEFTDASKGIILVDRSDGTKYRLYIEAGELKIEQLT